MATLKISKGNDRHIWLPNVKQVEEQCMVYPQQDYENSWDAVMPTIKCLKQMEPRTSDAPDYRPDYLAAELNILTYPNYPAIGKVTKTEILKLLLVVLDVPGDVVCQNWLVRNNQNYLLENGKTIDRI